MAYYGILWHTLAYSVILWHTLAYSDIPWHTLAYSGILWHILAYFGTLWHTLSYSVILWHIQSYSGIFRHTLAYSCILWHTLAYSGILWHTLARFFFHRLYSYQDPLFLDYHSHRGLSGMSTIYVIIYADLHNRPFPRLFVLEVQLCNILIHGIVLIFWAKKILF